VLFVQSKQALSPQSVTGGEVVFRKNVLSFSSTKNGRYPLLEERNGLFSWHISPLFDFATSNQSGHQPFREREF
jgi:hypothetical protein